MINRMKSAHTRYHRYIHLTSERYLLEFSEGTILRYSLKTAFLKRLKHFCEKNYCGVFLFRKFGDCRRGNFQEKMEKLRILSFRKFGDCRRGNLLKKGLLRGEFFLEI